jgi:outer membrane protein assembly factor BamB
MRTPRPSTLALVLAAAAAAWCPRPAAAQELALPAVDESPSSQLLLEQASAQAAANPREAVRLLVEALDAGPARLVPVPGDGDLFVPVGRRVRAILEADRSLRTAFRREVGPDADARLAEGALGWLVDHRLDTAAGLEAAVRLAESDIARGRMASAQALLERVQGHDLLAGPRASRVEALLAAARRGPAAGETAVPGLGPGSFRPPSAGARWGETWRLPLGRATVFPTVLPSVLGEQVVVADGTSIRSLDALTGRQRWSTAIGGTEAEGPRGVATDGWRAIATTSVPAAGARPASGGLACVDLATGAIAWDARIDRLAGDRSFEGAVPQGVPLVVDGRVIVAVRKSTARFENVTALACVDLESPGEAAWSRVIATSGSIRAESMRADDSPVLDGGTVYMATSTGAVAAVDARDGHVRWVRRFGVPVRDAVTAVPPSAMSTPAVVGGLVFAVTPDRARIVALAAGDGRVAAELPTGAGSGPVGPSYLVGDRASGLVFVAGERITCLRATVPPEVAWTVPSDGGNAPAGRVTVAATADPAAPALVVPGSSSTLVLDGRDGSTLLRLDGLRDANATAVGAQFVAGGVAAVSSWMPLDEAERAVRDRMARSQELTDSMALLSLARQVRSGPLAAEGAAECVRRARDAARPGEDVEALLALLLAVDAEDIASGADRDAVVRALEEAARLAGMPALAGFARAERLLRDRDPRGAAFAAVETALASPEAELGRFREGYRSPDCMALRVLAEAREQDRERCAAGAGEACDRALAAARGEPRAAVLRSAARLGAGTPAGARALEECVAASPGDLRTALLVDECLALGATAGPAAQALLSDRRGGHPAARRWPSVAGGFARAIEFRGSLPRHLSDAAPIPGGMLTVLDGDLAFRAAPGWAVAWRVPLRTRGGCVVVTTEPSIIVSSDDPEIGGRLTCVDRDGSVRWTAEVPVPAPAPDAASDPLAASRIRSAVPVALPSGPSIVVVGTDGALTAFDRATGSVRWRRTAPAGTLEAWARSPLCVALAEEIEVDGRVEVRVTVLDPGDGSEAVSWAVPRATDSYWLRIADGGLAVVATDVGLHARRIAGGDGTAPFWSIDLDVACQSSEGWAGNGMVAFIDSDRALSVASCWTGALRLGADAAAPGAERGLARDVRFGPGWTVVLHDEGAAFLGQGGAPAGRTAPGPQRRFAAAAVAADRLFVLDDLALDDESAGLRQQALLHDFDPRAGGVERSPPLLLRALGRRLGELSLFDGGVAVGNGSSVQLLEYGAAAASPPAAR